MEYRQLGHHGPPVSRVALGTMTWGLDTDATEAAAQLRTFRDAGGTLIDTAGAYQDGRAETILGDLFAHTGARDELVLATKAEACHDTDPARGGGSPEALLTALDHSLRRLRIDHIDLWQLHAWDPRVPLENTLAAGDAAVTSGKVRYIGVSNYSAWQLATAATHQQAHADRAPLSSTQMEYSLLERGIEHEIVPAAHHHGIGLLPWAPLGRGVLTGKYRDGTPPDSRAATSLARYVDHHRTERAARIVRAVVTAAEGLTTTPAALALAWVRDRPGVTAPVLGARTANQLRETLRCEEIQIPTAVQAALDDVSDPLQHTPTPTHEPS